MSGVCLLGNFRLFYRKVAFPQCQPYELIVWALSVGLLHDPDGVCTPNLSWDDVWVPQESSAGLGAMSRVHLCDAGILIMTVVYLDTALWQASTPFKLVPDYY